MRVAALGRAILSGLQDGGVVGIVNHIPGHGRALLDSHEELPAVAASDRALQSDLAPFAALRDAALAMTCHVVFNTWDPKRPETLSPPIIDSVLCPRPGSHRLLIIAALALTGQSGDIPGAP